MVNIALQRLSDEEHRFIEQIASLLGPWGMASSSARVYGYLLLHEGPVNLDQIAADLRMSKVSAWKAARSLEDFGHVRRYGEPGSKRALYGPTDSFETPMAKQGALLGALGSLLQTSASTIAKTGAAPRLEQMGQFYLSAQSALETTIREMNAKRSAAKR